MSGILFLRPLPNWAQFNFKSGIEPASTSGCYQCLAITALATALPRVAHLPIQRVLPVVCGHDQQSLDFLVEPLTAEGPIDSDCCR
jgi:hypothetical protein